MTDSSTTTPGRGNLARALVLSAAVLATLLLGAAVGLLIQLPTSDSSSPVPAADSVDTGFCQDMSMHHLQAVQMANIARERSTDEDVRSLAFDIASTQLEQVGRMKGWLMLWSRPEQPQAGRHMAWMTEGDAHGHTGTGGEATTGSPMPGMATSEELAKLRSLSGTEFDVYFLQLMLRHHQGGTAMVRYGVDHAEQHAVRTLAESMLKSQSAESEYMTDLLAQRDATPLPAPTGTR